MLPSLSSEVPASQEGSPGIQGPRQSPGAVDSTPPIRKEVKHLKNGVPSVWAQENGV